MSRTQAVKCTATPLEAADRWRISGADILGALRAAHVDLSRFRAFEYDAQLEAYRLVSAEETFECASEQANNTPARLELAIEAIDPAMPQLLTPAYAQRSAPLPAIEEVKAKVEHGGFFGIGILRGKTESNHGTLWRSAYQLGASFIFTIGARHSRREDVVDTTNAWTQIPSYNYADWADFVQNGVPYSATLVAVEMGGTPLDEFEHPARAVYLLGSEDIGLSRSVLAACPLHVTIPTARVASFNVAVAGSIIMYDRHTKLKAPATTTPTPTLLPDSSTSTSSTT